MRVTRPARSATSGRATVAVSAELVRIVYDTPASLPGERTWMTPSDDVRQLEELLNIPAGTIGAPLWVSADRDTCPNCGRVVSWLDIVASAVGGVHERGLVSRVILGKQRFVNVEAPEEIAGVNCFRCGTAILGIRSFKCHNWAYAHGEVARLIRASSPGK